MPFWRQSDEENYGSSLVVAGSSGVAGSARARPCRNGNARNDSDSYSDALALYVTHLRSSKFADQRRSEAIWGRVRFVTENYGASKLSERYGLSRYPAVFVDDILFAGPGDFG